MIRKEAKAAPFDFKPYSRKQLQVMYWWNKDVSPYAGLDGIIASGSIRSGKTICFLDSYTNWSILNFKGQDFIISGRSSRSLERNVIKPLKSILSAKGINYEHNRGDGWIDFGSNRHWLFGANTESAQDVLAGATCAGALADEAARQPISFINEIIARLSVKGSKFWFNCNPKGRNHPFKKTYIDKAAENNTLLLSFGLDDNLTLDKSIKEKYKRMFGGVFYKRNILGQWVDAEGAVYDMLDEDDHCITGPASRFKNYCLGVDFGLTHPTAACLLGWDNPNEVFQVSEWGYSRREGEETWTIQRIEQGISGWLSSLGITGQVDTYLDPSAAAFKAQLRAAQGKVRYRMLSTDNSQADGLPYMQTAFTDRRLKLYIDHCKRTWEQLCGLVWDGKATEKGKDAVVKSDDDWPDALRYAFYSRFGKKMARAMDLNL